MSEVESQETTEQRRRERNERANAEIRSEIERRRGRPSEIGRRLFGRKDDDENEENRDG